MPSLRQRLSALLKRPPRPVDARLVHPLARKSISLHMAREPYRGVPSLEATIVSPSSDAFQEARALQAARFARASMPKPGAPSYTDTVEVDPDVLIPFVVHHRETGLLLGTACLELPSPKSFATAVQFVAGSEAEQVAREGRFAEIRGFAARSDLDWWQKLDLIDALAGVVAPTARQLGVEWLWAQPRSPAMSLFLAEIPDLLPPYRFVRLEEVAGWHEDSAAFAELRALRLKELPLSAETLPLIYQIAPAVLAQDLDKRLALLERRHQTADLPDLFQSAMLQAHRKVRAELALTIESRQGKNSHVA